MYDIYVVTHHSVIAPNGIGRFRAALVRYITDAKAFATLCLSLYPMFDVIEVWEKNRVVYTARREKEK